MEQGLNILYEEHTVIVNAIDIVSKAKSLIGYDDKAYENIINDLLKFFHDYADQYHHHKEEEILFPEMIRRNEMLADGVIKEMLDNHADFRSIISDIKLHLSEKNYKEAQELLENYTQNLLDHIAVENEEVFQIAESLFSEKELENIYFRFKDCDREYGNDKKESLIRLAESIRSKLLT